MNALEIKGLCKKYKHFELQNINLTLPSGYIMGLIGENGAGKSTLIRLIAGLSHRDSGTITVLGRDNREDFHVTKEDVGIMPHMPGFPYCLNAKQINKIMALTYKRWDEHGFFDYLNRFSLPTDKPFKLFSQGMRMKLGIAAVLSHDPKLLILDEPTNGLDPVVRDEVNEILSEFTRDESHSILISSHIVSDLERLCDYIAFLHNGKLVLCEEKDGLTEKFAFIQCSEEELEQIPKEALRGVRRSRYNVEAVAERRALPVGIMTRPVTIEELFVFMAKEEV